MEAGCTHGLIPVVSTRLPPFFYANRVCRDGANLKNLSADLHTHAIRWTPKKAGVYFDGREFRHEANLNAHHEASVYLITQSSSAVVRSHL